MNHAIDLLGRYYGDAALTEFLDELGIRKAPKLGKGDDDAWLTAPDRGVELIFTIEDKLDVKPIMELPEGALVLANITFYGGFSKEFKRFDGQLPFDLTFGLAKDAVKAQMPGTPTESLGGIQLRWTLATHVLYAKFKDDRLSNIAIQLPLA